jgi:hypothetical protein
VVNTVVEEPAPASTTAEDAGTAGNEQLTATTGIVLLVLLAVLGVTIIQIGQLIWLHLFLGLLLIGPVTLKMASTGYRFTRYYAGDRAYVGKGPPPLLLRLLAPAVVITTVTVFVSGVLLMFAGPAHRDPLLLIHKVSFIAWIACTALHVLGHLPGLGGTLREATATHGPSSRYRAGRWIALSSACAAGLVLALVLIPDFSAWTAHASVFHHHHRG